MFWVHIFLQPPKPPTQTHIQSISMATKKKRKVICLALVALASVLLAGRISLPTRKCYLMGRYNSYLARDLFGQAKWWGAQRTFFGRFIVVALSRARPESKVVAAARFCLNRNACAEAKHRCLHNLPGWSRGVWVGFFVRDTQSTIWSVGVSENYACFSFCEWDELSFGSVAMLLSLCIQSGIMHERKDVDVGIWVPIFCNVQLSTQWGQ